MRLEDYVISNENVDLEEINLDGFSEWEKETILKVLKRNNRVKYRDELRLEQLAVRVQMQRLTDQRTVRDESTIKTKTGEWHRDLVRRRCSGKSLDVPATLYRRISLDLITHEPRRHHSRTARSSPTSSPCSSGSIVRSPSSQISSEKSPSDADMDETWAEEAEFSASCFNPSPDANELSNNKHNDTDLSKQLSQNIKKEALDQREI